MKRVYATSLLALCHIAAAQDNIESVSDPIHVRVGWKPEPRERGTVSLIYTCLATIFACTWTVLHLNAPAFDDSALTVGFRKAKWMAITILFPEFIFAKGVSDLRSAMEDLIAFDWVLRNIYKDGLEWKIVSQSGKLEHTIKWKVEFGSNAKYICLLLGISWPPQDQDGNPHIDAEKLPSVTARSNKSCGGKQGNDVICTSPEPDIPNLKQTQEPSPGDQITQSRGEHAIQDESECLSIAGSQRFTAKRHLTEDECNHAASQPSSAERIPHRFSTIQDWTPTHAYFANMGGLLFPTPSTSEKNPEYHVLTGAHLGPDFTWYRDECHPLKGLVLSKEDIDDRSKADWLMKGFTVLQISWLLLTLLARAIQRLPVSQLEVATLAFAISAIATYIVNWWRPKDIKKPIKLQTVASGFFPEQTDSRQLPQRFTIALSGWRESPSTFASQERVHNDRVLMKSNLPSMWIIGAVANLVFSGLHCLAWNFEFPSRTELILWRVSSVVSAVLPGVVASAGGYVNRLLNGHPSCAGIISKIEGRWDSKHEDWDDAVTRWANSAAIGGAAIYAASRIIILVLLFTTLRAAPGGIYEVTPWTIYLPSIS